MRGLSLESSAKCTQSGECVKCKMHYFLWEALSGIKTRAGMGAGRRQTAAPARVELTVHGEAQANADGSSRQAIIAKLKVGDAVHLVRERDNEFDANAVRVESRGGTIGYIARDEAEDMA